MASTDSNAEKGEALRLYLRRCVPCQNPPPNPETLETASIQLNTHPHKPNREVDPFLLRALTELLLHKPQDVPGALRRYLAWRRAQREAHTEAFAAAGGGLDYEGDARPPWLEGLAGVEGEGEGEGYAALRVAPVLRALVRHVLAGAEKAGEQELPAGAALEEGMAAFLDSWTGEDTAAAVVAEEAAGAGATLEAAALGSDVTLLVLGLGGAGKSTVVAALQGEADAQVCMYIYIYTCMWPLCLSSHVHFHNVHMHISTAGPHHGVPPAHGGAGGDHDSGRRGRRAAAAAPAPPSA